MWRKLVICSRLIGLYTLTKACGLQHSWISLISCKWHCLWSLGVIFYSQILASSHCNDVYYICWASSILRLFTLKLCFEDQIVLPRLPGKKGSYKWWAKLTIYSNTQSIVQKQIILVSNGVCPHNLSHFTIQIFYTMVLHKCINHHTKSDHNLNSPWRVFSCISLHVSFYRGCMS